MAAITGIVEWDSDYDGIGNAPWTVPPQSQPVTINVFQGAIGGTPYGTAVTNPTDGTYSYPDDAGDALLVDGNYFLVPAPVGAIITSGNSPFAFTVQNNTVITPSPGMIFIDDFDEPVGFDSYIIWNPPVPPPGPPFVSSPFFQTYNPTDEFTQRDLTVTVPVPSAQASVSGTIGTMPNGQGLYSFGSGDGTQASLVYNDGAVHNLLGLAPPNQNQGFRLEFAQLQTATDINYTITVTDNTPTTVAYVGTLSQLLDPVTFEPLPFSEYIAFTSFPGIDFSIVTSVQVDINSGAVPVPEVDFELDTIVAGNPAVANFAAAFASKTLFMSGIGIDPLAGLAPAPAPAPGGITVSAVTTLQGTDGNDLFEFIAAETLDRAVVRVNGVAVAIGPSMNTVEFDGLGGDDTAILVGTDGSEMLSLWADSGTLAGESWAVNLTAVESVEADGRGGNDAATFYGSDGDDEFVASPQNATITMPTGDHSASGFETIVANAVMGGDDTADLYDSAGNDRFVSAPNYGTLTGDGFSLEALSFGSINAFATAGGNDSARMYDSPGDDILNATSIEAVLYGDGFSNQATYFESVNAFASAGGYDIALLLDSEGDDTFHASPTEGVMQGDGYSNRVKQFEEIRGDAPLGGHDTAKLVGSPSDDYFYGSLTEAVLFGSTYYNQANSFDSVEADAAGGDDDRAWLFDSLGDDQLTADDDWARLLLGLNELVVSDFDWVEASSINGGNDTKHVEPIDFLLQFEGLWTDV